MAKRKYKTREVAPESRDPVPRAPVPATHLMPRRCRVCNSDRVAAVSGSHVNASGFRVQHCECARCGARSVFIFDRV